MRVTTATTQATADKKGVSFSVSRYGKKFGFEYWTNESIKETGQATQFKGNLKEFHSFLQSLSY